MGEESKYSLDKRTTQKCRKTL